MSQINICFSSDANYAQHCAVSIASILKNANPKDDLSIYILDGGLSSEDKNKFFELNKIKKFNLEFIQINNETFKNAHIPESSHFSQAIYYRFLIPLLFPHIDKIIYLDSDVIVKTSLQELYNTDITNYYAGMIPDIDELQNKKRVKLKENSRYCNSGVMLINCKMWRDENFCQTAIEFAALNNTYCPDQDLINVHFQDKLKILSTEWNHQCRSSYLQNSKYDLKQKHKIIHYIDKYKPWDTLFGHPLYKDYYKYIKMTEFYNKNLFNYIDFFVRSVFTYLLNIKSVKYFTEYYNYKKMLKDYNFKQRLEELSQKYKNKKILIYGAGIIFSTIRANYNLSKLNIIGLSDMKFEKSKRKTYKKYKAIVPTDIVKENPDVILISTMHTLPIESFLQKIYKDKNIPMPKIEQFFNSISKQKEEALIKKEAKRHSETFNNLLFTDMILKKNRYFNCKTMIESANHISLIYPKGYGREWGHNIEIAFAGKKVSYLDDDNWQSADLFIIMAFGSGSDKVALEKIYCMNTPVIVAEETFLRSITPLAGSPIACNQNFLDAVSYFLDAKGPHFYPGTITSLEELINSDFELSTEQLDYSKKLISKIIENNLSKYNSQPIKKPSLINNGKKNILIIDQVIGDMSITLSGGDINVFKDMLNSAIKENPDCNIIIKSHVDTRKSHFQDMDLPQNAYFYSEPINLLCLLKEVDKVYAYSSAGGMEALLLNKEVHIFGSPVYAGWGLTHDRRIFINKTKSRTIEELFYLIYVEYSLYCNPITKQICSIEEAIDVLINLREEYFETYSIK